MEHGLGEWTGKITFKASPKHVDGSDMYATLNTGYRGVSLKSFRKLFLTELAMSSVPVSTLHGSLVKPMYSMKRDYGVSCPACISTCSLIQRSSLHQRYRNNRV